MKIVGVTACMAGIAHTYLVKEKILNAARELGHEAKIETQGSIGTECKLTQEDIANADAVLLACDILISGKERFKGKKVVELPMKVVMQSPKGVLNKIEEMLNAQTNK